MKQIILILTLILTSSTLTAQKLSFTVDNVADSTVYLARYFGPKLYYADTTEMKDGKFSFDASKHDRGLFAIVIPGGKYFEFIHDNEDVDMHVKDPNNFVSSMKVNKSVNNTLFYDYIRFMGGKKKEGGETGAAMNALDKSDKAKREEYRNKLIKINEDVISYQKNLISKNDGLFIALMIKMSMDVELPDHPRNAAGEITDSNYVYHYYIDHFWDNVNLKDPRTVRTPIFHNKLEKYFSSKGILQIPDTVSLYARKLIDLTDDVDQNNKVFQYIVHYVTNKYETSNIMGMDKVFCFMAQNYYCGENNKAYWMTEESTTKVCERAEKVCRTAIGSFAPKLVLTDSTEENWIDVYDINADYTVLYFWDPNCGHCKKVTPKLQTLYEKKLKERNIEVYAIGKATGEEFDQWKEYIKEKGLTFINVGLTQRIYDEAIEDPTRLLKEHTNIQSLNYADTYDIYSTPRIFILDKEKRIIFKQLSIGQLEEILDKETGHAADEKLFPVEDPENGNEDDASSH